MERPFLEIDGLAKRFPSPDGGEPLTVFENVNLDINKGEFVCIHRSFRLRQINNHEHPVRTGYGQ